MFLVLIRVIMLFGVLAAIYVGVAVYLRWDRRVALEEEFEAGAGQGLTREDYVTRGLAHYERSWSKKALLGIFALPLVVIGAVWLLTLLG